MNKSYSTSKTNKKRILFLSDAFDKPAFNPRARYFANALCRAGYEVDYITEEVHIAFPFKHDFNLISIPYYKQKGILLKLEWLFKFGIGLLIDAKNNYFYRSIIKKQSSYKYNAIVCSSFHTFPQPLAARLAHKWNIPYIADIRDIAEQSDGDNYNAHHLKNKWLNKIINHCFQKKNIQRRNKALLEAQAVTTVSPWHQSTLKCINENTHLIYNGFDPRLFTFKAVKTKHFDITYTGKIYPLNMQDPTLLFECIHDLLYNKNIDSHPKSLISEFLLSLHINWYVNSATKKRLQKWAQDFKIEHYMHYFDYIEPQKIPGLLQQSSILLVLSNTVSTKGPHGIMTTKFFEALGVEKPILCVQSDEDCLAHTIKATKSGIAAKSKKEIANFLLRQFQIWQTYRYTHLKPNTSNIVSFSRETQAQQLISIVNKHLEG